MFYLQNITKTYKEESVLSNVNFALSSGEVVALIGDNGAGKTTLLKIMLGEIQPDEGVVSLQHEVLGYVPQEPRHQEQTIEASFGSIELWRIEYALSLVDLGAFGSQRVSELSGGQKTRLAIAQVLAQDPEPTVLLLDEPTNNIDADGLLWLEQFIKNFQGAVLLVSHDRDFINKLSTSIVELKSGGLKRYGGNYDFYLEQRALERAAEEKAYEANVEEKKRLEASIRLQRENGKHTHDHMRSKDGDKMQNNFFRNRVTVKLGQQARNLEARLKKLEDVKRPDSLKNYKITMKSDGVHDKKLVTVDGVFKSYGDKKILEGMSLEVRGHDRLRVQGPNGSGKSTLLKLIASRLSADAGNVALSADLNSGYFSQDVDGLNYEVSALENITVDGISKTDLYRSAMSMGLDQSDLKKLPNELSRGQQAKLAFTKLLLGRHDLIILDEPTNHLDISTKERLESALNDYDGALIIASHDTYFVRAINITRHFKLKKSVL